MSGMSKPSSSRLTPSRKKRRRAARPDTDWRDAMETRCWRLDMMAELLAACGQPLEPAVLECVGHWFSQETEAMRSLLNQLGKGAR